MKNFLRNLLALTLCALLTIGCVACGGADDSATPEASENSDTSDFASSGPNLMWGDKPLGDSDSSATSPLRPQTSVTSGSDVLNVVISSDNKDKSAAPKITVASQVARDVFVVAGVCSKFTEKINISGDGITAVSTSPFAGKDNGYFAAQVKFGKSTTVKVTAIEKGKATSDTAEAYVVRGTLHENYMERGEYAPVFGNNSRMHFYSSILAYSQDTAKFNSSMESIAKNNIRSIVSAGKKVGAETIFLIIPSSADIYPETVPVQYKKTSGERLYEVFSDMATSYGAKVIYPIDTMKKHKNDGEGYQLYQHTDSHWSTYGAYWGTYDMLNHIGKEFPAAKPRTLSQMDFYTAEMHAGDAFFNFPHNIGFENSYGDGTTYITGIKELTTLYKLKMPTDTLKKVYNNLNGLYLTQDNAAAATVSNKNGNGLPTALIMRDSFGKIAYDMLNDRFKTVYWGEFDNYNLSTDTLSSKKPDYLIYMYSERNLLKIMLNNSQANLLNLK